MSADHRSFLPDCRTLVHHLMCVFDQENEERDSFFTSRPVMVVILNQIKSCHRKVSDDSRSRQNIFLKLLFGGGSRLATLGCLGKT